MIGQRWILGPGARGALAALIVSIAGAGYSAHAGLTRGVLPAPPPPPASTTGFEAEDHFPGAALLTAIEDDAAPAPGTTGTADLSNLAMPIDVPLQDGLADGTIYSARPFALRGTAIDQMRALQCLTTAIYYEAASEPDDGQAAVAQVILNRVRHPAFPATVCGVIYQGSARRGCQFSYACDGSMARVPMRSAWERARRAAARALAGYVYAPVGVATHYHTYAVTPSWNRGLVMTGVVGAHFFHRWKGFWGTPAAFRQSYAGGEPLPGPLREITPPGLATITPVVAATTAGLLRSAATPAAGPTPPANIVAAHAETGVVRAEYAESQVLDRWKDSGKPLR